MLFMLYRVIGNFHRLYLLYEHCFGILDFPCSQLAGFFYNNYRKLSNFDLISLFPIFQYILQVCFCVLPVHPLIFFKPSCPMVKFYGQIALYCFKFLHIRYGQLAQANYLMFQQSSCLTRHKTNFNLFFGKKSRFVLMDDYFLRCVFVYRFPIIVSSSKAVNVWRNAYLIPNF